MTTANRTTASAQETSKSRPAFYTRQGASVAVALWTANASGDRAPGFIGKIAGENVSGFVRKGPKAPFIDFKSGAKDENGHDKTIATGNVRVGVAGIPKLVLTMGGETVWVEVSKDVSDEALVALGFDMDKSQEKRAEHAAAKAAKAEKEAA